MELRHLDGGELLPFTTGSHIMVAVPNGSRRNYSLCTDPCQQNVWQIAIKQN